MPDEPEAALKRLIKMALAGDFDLGGLRTFPFPDRFLEGLRPFFEAGDGDFSSDSGYPKLRNFYRTFVAMEEGLTAWPASRSGARPSTPFEKPMATRLARRIGGAAS